jgi:hypothetical protein
MTKGSGERARASTRKRIAMTALLLLVVAVIGGGAWFYRALSYVPEFYSEALAVKAPELQQFSREMLRRSAALTNALKRLGDWQALFTDQQINGWLAVDVPKNHPDLLPPELRNPRVRITRDGVQIGALFEGEVSSVVSVEFDVKLESTNLVAVRIRKVRVGDVPWRLDRIVDEIIQAAAQWGLHVEQTQTDGDPVLLVSLPPDLQSPTREVHLERLELREGEVFLSGRSNPRRGP